MKDFCGQAIIISGNWNQLHVIEMLSERFLWYFQAENENVILKFVFTFKGNRLFFGKNSLIYMKMEMVSAGIRTNDYGQTVYQVDELFGLLGCP